MIAAVFIFLSAISTAQFANYWRSQEVSQRTAILGAVYLDNLSANVVPSVLAKDMAGITLALERTLAYYEGIRDQSLFLFDETGRLLARARRDDSPTAEEIPKEVFGAPAGLTETNDDEIAWVWRPLVNDGAKIGKLVAALDIAPLNESRRRFTLYVLLGALATSTLAALAGIWLIRAQLNPIAAVSRHLERVGRGRLEEIPATATTSVAFATLRDAFNKMVVATRERELMDKRLAEQNSAAVLGRLAATVVHEVKNPLGGIVTAVETVKKYGDDPAVRREALGLVERGLETISRVIDATLWSYKGNEQRRSLSSDDLADVRTLIEAEARQRGVGFQARSDLPMTVPVPAVKVRQVLLNLLLNACRATPEGGEISLHTAIVDDKLRMEISDGGPGLDPALIAALKSGVFPTDSYGLGIPIVLGLMEEMQGSIEVNSERTGTRLTVTIPLERANGDP